MVRSTRILIVEDEVYLRDIYVDVLKDAGYDVEAVGDGDSALAKMSQDGYDLVLLDVMLPGKDGYQVLKEITSHPNFKENKKIVLMTNLSNDTVKLPEGIVIDGLIVKANINPGEFLEKVKNYLKK